MASQEQIDATYNYMDRVWRVCLGEHADISCAMYLGDFSLTLEEAQKNKHNYILEHTNFRTGGAVLDIGCGWGGFLKTVHERGGHGVGLTLSTKQAKHGRRSGLEVHLRDWKDVDSAKLGRFDAIASMGAFEHFCSEDEYLEGKQDRIYSRFFQFCYDHLLPEKGRMFLQTMTFDRYIPDPNDITLAAEDGSDAHVLALVRKFYPGSWLPRGMDQISEAAQPCFKVVSSNCGREDYIETINQWNQRLKEVSTRRLLAKLSILPYLVKDPELRHKLKASRRSVNQECFKRRLMNHYRIIFEKKNE